MDSGHNGFRSPYRCKDCDFCSEDADKIQVSISPRRFTLPPPSERLKTMEIENKNSYPIYFKAGTSNMGAFRPQPNMGKIPANSKISVTVQFFDSAMPIRRHEEVLVIASIKPFDEFSTYSDNICPYCYESMQLSKYHQTRKLEDDSYFDESRFLQRTTLDHHPSKELLDYKNYKNSAVSKSETQPNGYSSKEIHEPKKEISSSRQFSAPKEELQSSGYCSKKMDEFVKMPKSSGEQLLTEREEQVKKTRCTNGLEEICLHAFIHRPTNGTCHCDNCGELAVLQSGDIQIRNLLAKTMKEHKATEPLLSKHEAGKLYTDTRKDNTDQRFRKDLEKELREKRREAHILARIIKARDAKNTSDTEISEMSSKDMKLGKLRPKFISEEDFKKKMQKARSKKHQKHLKEDSLSTTATDITTTKESEKSPRDKYAIMSAARKNAQQALTSIDCKCTTILQLTWTTFFFLLLLFIMFVAFIIYFVFLTSSNDNNGSSYARLPCFFSLFH